MNQYNSSEKRWYTIVRSYTERLLRIRSISPGTGEIRIATEVLNLLCEDNLQDAYTFCKLDPIKGDIYRRQNTYAFLEGTGRHTLLICGHFDTVDTQAYEALEPWACDPDGLNARLDTLRALVPEIEEDLTSLPDDWLFGRGALDMKSGLAAAIAVMRHYAKLYQKAKRPLSLLFLATADEENESAGILQAVRFLAQLREQYGLEYVGAINMDWTSSLYPGDPHRYIYAGSIGKLLPSFFIVGKEAHAGVPFDGIDADLLAASLIQHFSMNNAFGDRAGEQMTPPPVTLHSSDLKTRYDIQVPSLAHFNLNVLTFTTLPDQLLRRLQQDTQAILEQTLQNIDSAEHQWAMANHLLGRNSKKRIGMVLTYAELYDEAICNIGQQQVHLALADEEKRWPIDIDKRERCLHIINRLWVMSGKQGPAVIIYYAPPYYPHVQATHGPLYEAVLKVIRDHAKQKLVLLEYFPFLSDMSYLQFDADIDLSILQKNMPIWRSIDAAVAPNTYNLPLQEMKQLQIPVINIGPYGRGAHQSGERVLMSYSFEVVPQLLQETIEELVHLLPLV